MKPNELPRYRVMSFRHRGERRAYYVRDDWESSLKFERRIGGIHTHKQKAERECSDLNADLRRMADQI